jgi:PadR family transcriptional regulator
MMPWLDFLCHFDYLCIDYLWELCGNAAQADGRRRGEPLNRRKGQRDLLPGTLEMLILQTLRRGPLHGYAIARHIQEASEDVLQVEEGSLYPALQRLLREGWVVADWGISARNHKVRTYKLTPAGRKQLDREIAGFERLLAGIGRVIRPAES